MADGLPCVGIGHAEEQAFTTSFQSRTWICSNVLPFKSDPFNLLYYLNGLVAGYLNPINPIMFETNRESPAYRRCGRQGLRSICCLRTRHDQKSGRQQVGRKYHETRGTKESFMPHLDTPRSWFRTCTKKSSSYPMKETTKTGLDLARATLPQKKCGVLSFDLDMVHLVPNCVFFVSPSGSEIVFLEGTSKLQAAKAKMIRNLFIDLTLEPNPFRFIISGFKKWSKDSNWYTHWYIYIYISIRVCVCNCFCDVSVSLHVSASVSLCSFAAVLQLFQVAEAQPFGKHVTVPFFPHSGEK